ncbi:hypothetical protein [Streptomyces guryensis]|uniref:hypothetical protein n=1 Tax=Streptomyces guryensis TaxID=2886947 RepID=UPI0027DFA023|nr:hypothetical protein [Streptomyces guryensis]
MGGPGLRIDDLLKLVLVNVSAGEDLHHAFLTVEFAKREERGAATTRREAGVREA